MPDNVIPFERGRRAKPAPEPPAAPKAPEHQHLHRRTRQASQKAQALVAEQTAADRDKYVGAFYKQEAERLLREEKSIPARITMALDVCGLDGPDVDTACGAAEPDVDNWECGTLIPTADQVRLLSKLTGFPIRYFYLPVETGPQLAGVIMCWTDKRGCESVEPNVIDEHGVLHYGGEPRRTPPAPVQGTLF